MKLFKQSFLLILTYFILYCQSSTLDNCNKASISTADKRECESYKEFKEKLLSDIAKDGLKIGNRWIIRQESTFFVIRDVVGSQTKDSRIAFPANSYLNPT